MTRSDVVLVSIVTSLAVCATVFAGLYLKYKPEIDEANKAQKAVKDAEASIHGFLN